MNTATTDPKDDVAPIIAAFRAELGDAAKSLALLVRFEVPATSAGKIAAAFARTTPLTLREPGCRVFQVNCEARSPGRFVVYERWQNLGALEAHLRTDYTRKLRAEIEELMVGAPEFHVLRPADDAAP